MELRRTRANPSCVSFRQPAKTAALRIPEFDVIEYRISPTLTKLRWCFEATWANGRPSRVADRPSLAWCLFRMRGIYDHEEQHDQHGLPPQTSGE